MFSSLCSVVLMVGINVEWSYLFCVRGGAGWLVAVDLVWTLCLLWRLGPRPLEPGSLDQWPDPGVTSCLATRRVWRSRGVRRCGCAGAGVSRNNQQAVITALGCWHRSHHTQLLATCWLVSTGVRGLDCGHRTELLLLLLLMLLVVMVKMVTMVTAGWCVVRRLAAWWLYWGCWHQSWTSYTASHSQPGPATSQHQQRLPPPPPPTRGNSGDTGV